VFDLDGDAFIIREEWAGADGRIGARALGCAGWPELPPHPR
jgi:hypothetical protein